MQQIVSGQLASACSWPDTQRDALVEAVLERHGPGVQAILVYGSYLRGRRDSLLDLYVLLDGYRAFRSAWQAALAWLLPPNVYQVRHGSPPGEARAKYALLTLGRFSYAMRHDFHGYFWARFAQPCGLLYCRDEAAREQVVQAVATAACTFVRRVLPRLPERFDAEQLVRRGLSLSYRCELRSEPPEHAGTLYAFNPAWYQAMLASLEGAGPGLRRAPQGAGFCHSTGRGRRALSAAAWGLRRVQGKLLSVLRLLKAALTFSGGFDYLLWKIERHSGARVEPTPAQRKYPLLLAWPLLWRLYRRGAFR